MIFYENEIKRMSIWEKVVQVSNDVEFVAPSVEQAKIKISRGMATYGLVLFQASEGLHKLVNVHNANEYIEVIGETRDNVLLDVFNVTIMQETAKAVEEVKTFEPKQTFNVVNTPNEAVTRVNEVAEARQNITSDLHQLLVNELQTALKYSKNDKQVPAARLTPIYRKIAVLGWNKAEFKNAICLMLNIDEDKYMSNDQCTTIIDYLASKEKDLLEGQQAN